MTPDTFLERLDAAARGKLSKQAVLEPFLDGLEKMMGDFGDALDQQPEELRDFLAAYVEAIEEGAEACEELALECLGEQANEESFLELGDAHTHLNRLLLDFHSQSWVFRGPTQVDWINMVVDGGERFLEGENFPRYLPALLDEHVRDLELRLACHPALEGEALLKVTRQFAAWSRGEENLNRHQLQDLMIKMIGYAERFGEYLTKQPASLEQLLASLGGDVPDEEILWLLDGVLTELRRIRTDFESTLGASRAPLKVEVSRLISTLGDLESAISALAEQGSGQVEDADLDDLHELHELLEKEIATFQRAASKETPVVCPQCGQESSPRLSQCASCSAPLAASSFNMAESEGVKGEEEHVGRMRAALAGFEGGLLGLEQFRGEVLAARERLDLATRRFKARPRAPKTSREELFVESIALLERGLDVLTEVETPQEPELQEGKSLFFEGVGKLRQAGAST